MRIKLVRLVPSMKEAIVSLSFATDREAGGHDLDSISSSGMAAITGASGAEERRSDSVMTLKSAVRDYAYHTGRRASRSLSGAKKSNVAENSYSKSKREIWSLACAEVRIRDAKESDSYLLSLRVVEGKAV
ncbi:uncharacterized protein BDZ83DRAFT_282240 [Colletotrichum acutatum]|uniref:Uncharacterized protein n=1 Tax=Glomerella acutata TaxID=27357 RepID=A0AAD8UQ98_GLOAC|nr:uncharacterized protein BDZ83DRAFT_282240 [Colletotrichum acutatum]KAK1725768.1 hypothetical protein BDZ83DRAFT_282240 [Colletotrichum acutatum]